MSKTPATWKRRAQRLALLAAALLFTALVLEGGLRIYEAFFFPKLMTTDPVLGWRHRPNCQKPFKNEDGELNMITLNRHGMRGPAHDAKAEGAFRVLILGDSFTEAVHVSEAEMFAGRLAASDEKLEILNAGVGAWGTVQQYLFLREEGLAFQPDYVLLVAYENDLTDNVLPYSPGMGARPWARLDAKGDVEVIEDYDSAAYERFLVPVPFRAFLARNSYLFYAFNERVWQRLFDDKMRAIERADLKKISRPDRIRIFLGVVDKIRALLETKKIGFGLALIPTVPVLQKGDCRFHQAVRDHAKAAGFPCIDLAPVFLKSGTESALNGYFKKDIHWNKRGHAVASEAMLRLLKSAR